MFQELEIFVDPFAAGIEGMCLLHEKKDHSFGQTCLTQHKKMALIFFTDREHLTSFKDLYNNMQLPSYRYRTERPIHMYPYTHNPTSFYNPIAARRRRAWWCSLAN